MPTTASVDAPLNAMDSTRAATPIGTALRVLELSTDIGGAYCGWLLAKLGADVTRISSSGNSDCAARPAASPIGLGLAYLAEGKNTQVLSADEGRSPSESLAELLGQCDILVCDCPDELQRLTGEPPADLAGRYPRLVVGVCSTFGVEGPNAPYPAVALDAQAVSAVAWSLGEPDREPLSLPPGVLEHQSGVNLAAACLFAILVRDQRGTGCLVDIALADILASYVAGNCRIYVNHGLKWHRAGRRAYASGGAYPYVVLPCRDGEVCLCGRTREEWERLVDVMGRPEWSKEPRYQNLRAMGKLYPEEVDQLILPWLQQRTMAEIEVLASRHNLIVSPIRSFAEVLKTTQFTDRGFFMPFQAGSTTLQGPGLPFRILGDRAPNAEDRSRTMLSGCPEGSKALTGARGQIDSDHGTPRDRGTRASAEKPLAGTRLLDFGWVWSAPWVGAILAELGAQVIKVEHGARPDNTRLAGRPIRNGQPVEGPSKEMSAMFHQINHGKLGITLNAKEPRAVALLKRLAAKSDVVIENMSPGAMDRAGLGYAALRLVNPRIVMLSMSAAGQFGPLAQMRTYAPVMSSFVGLEALIGYRHEAPIGSLNFGLGDPNASVHGLVAVFAALLHSRQTGLGCYIDLSQIETLLATLGPYLIQTQATGSQTLPFGNGHPDMAPHGIYPAAGADTWLSVAVQNDGQWATLISLAEGEHFAADPRFMTVAGRLDHVDALDAALRLWTMRYPRDELVDRLRRAGIASSPVLSVEEQWHDANFVAREVKKRVELPFNGAEDLFRAPWRFSDMMPQIESCGPTLGQHNRLVFCDMLGLSDAEFADLEASGVIA